MLRTSELVLLLALVVVTSVATVQLSASREGVPRETQQQPVVVQVKTGNGDDRYRRAPRPQRFWEAEPEIPVRGALDPIPTRGAPESYQQMGVITGADGKVLPLYGRRVAPRSDYFNYYTRTDTYNPVALPVTYKNKDCQDNQGCSEIFSGESLRISPTGEVGKVTLYGFDGPRYSPEVA
jgi:hypothetical protein